MPTKPEKQQCLQYLCDRLEDSGLYRIIDRAEQAILVREKAEPGKRIRLFLPNFGGTIPEFREAVQGSQGQDTYVCPILYKDGKTAFVRMVDRNRSWRDDKSLKNYSARRINEMLHLRGKEKVAIGLFGPELQYYQPETEKLEESVRTFHLQPVDLDYSHLVPGDSGYGFAKDREAIDYKLPEESAPAITGPAKFMYTLGRKIAWLMKAAARAGTDPTKN